MKFLKRFWWRVRLTFWLVDYEYCEDGVAAWVWSGADEWMTYYEWDFTPEGAVLEDLSYGSE